MWVLVSAIVCGAALVGGLLMAGGMATPAMAVHGAVMLAAWGAMIPLGGIMARYHKVTRTQRFPAEVDNPFWWDWHRRLQYGGFALAVAGLATILSATGGQFDTAHGRCGLVVMAVGGLQIASPLFRGRKGGPTDARADPADPATWRGDHYDMTRRRRWFEAWHKTAGWTLIALAAITILLGIDLLGAPPWLIMLAGMVQGAVVFGLLDGVLRGRWVDTYAALWGPDPLHPGNRPPPGDPPVPLRAPCPD